MQIITRAKLLEMIREDGAENWHAVVCALEDGEYLKSIGVDDVDTPVIEDAHDHAERMAVIHPNYKF